jgi:hypothetical protein
LYDVISQKNQNVKTLVSKQRHVRVIIHHLCKIINQRAQTYHADLTRLLHYHGVSKTIIDQLSHLNITNSRHITQISDKNSIRRFDEERMLKLNFEVVDGSLKLQSPQYDRDSVSDTTMIPQTSESNSNYYIDSQTQTKTLFMDDYLLNTGIDRFAKAESYHPTTQMLHSLMRKRQAIKAEIETRYHNFTSDPTVRSKHVWGLVNTMSNNHAITRCYKPGDVLDIRQTPNVSHDNSKNTHRCDIICLFYYYFNSHLMQTVTSIVLVVCRI